MDQFSSHQSSHHHLAHKVATRDTLRFSGLQIMQQSASIYYIYDFADKILYYDPAIGQSIQILPYLFLRGRYFIERLYST